MPLLVVIGAIVMIAGAIARLQTVTYVGLAILIVGLIIWALAYDGRSL